MDVSNSTGQNTDYRIMGAGGGAAPTASLGDPKKKAVRRRKALLSGTLEPHTYVTLTLPDESPCVVQFVRGGKVISETPIEDKEILIALVPNSKGTPKPFVCRRRA